ncbi:DUF2945 domain-containing protein [Pseudonocardia oroxyli]|uniref:Hypervirulence associated protein TUDOR domain-containing protein n=1 Tax=Pseudonocardia oroxyli TaxID=366584 RepID=A0A1G7JK87_PSEOR|nr:DUF2945 domain-containing protein [Pseudonocardia oroxyli]SDF25348.1 hypothetical protein SAMN05216377_10479 [Pseudonocardia oroxyli]
MAKYRKGSRVAWNWGNGQGEGKVDSVHTDRVEKTIKGRKQSRNGTDDNPAYVLVQEDGTTVLKLESELEKA